MKTYQEVGSVSKATRARRCGIARSTLYRWIKRYPYEALSDRSRRPHHLAHQKWEEEVENLVLDIRDKYPYGKLRISSHLLQHYQIKISASSVGRILKKYERQPLNRFKKPKPALRYAKAILGERVQVDVLKIDRS